MKAQSSLELLVVFSILMIIFTAIAQQFYLKVQDTGIRAEQTRLKLLCSEISRAILTAKMTGNGYYEHIEFSPANLSFFPSVRALDIDRKVVCYLPTREIRVNSVGEEEIDIYNVNGSVVIG